MALFATGLVLPSVIQSAFAAKVTTTSNSDKDIGQDMHELANDTKHRPPSRKSLIADIKDLVYDISASVCFT